MGTYKKYIDDLEIQKNNLVTALNNKGIEATNAETLNTLVPKVANIEGAKEEQEKTASASPNGAVIVTPDTGKVLSKVTINTIPTTTQATPTIAVSSGGLITVTSKQTEGYVKAGTKTPIKQLDVQDAKTITPSTSSQTAVSAYKFTTGAITVAGDSNLTADNIKSGTSIFGVTGSYAGSSPNLQSKSVTYTENGTATITPDAGYDGLSSVDVTVDVVADVPLVTVTFKATQYGYEINSPGEDTFVEMKRIVISALVDGNISLNNMYKFSNQWGRMVFPFDVAVPQGSSVTICDNSDFGSGVSVTNALVAMANTAEGIKSVYTIYNITDGATITIDVS